MEEQAVNNQVAQAPVNPVSAKPGAEWYLAKSNYWIIGGIILILLLILSTIYVRSLPSRKPVFPPPKPLASPSPISPTLTHEPYSDLKGPCQVEEREKDKTIRCDKYPVTFQIPNDWEYLSNLASNEPTLENIKIYPKINDVVTDKNGCGMYLGPGGGHGPSGDLKNESIEIDGKAFTKRTWTENDTIIFISYLQNNKIGNLESVWVDLPSNPESCIKDIDQILSAFKFTDQEGIIPPQVCTQEAKLCPDGSYVGRQPPNCEFAPCP